MLDGAHRLAGPLRCDRDRRHAEQLIERPRDDDGVGLLEREEAELGLVAVKVEREVADDSLDVIQLRSGAGEEERVCVFVHGDDDLGEGVGVYGRGLGLRRGRVGRRVRGARGGRGVGQRGLERVQLLDHAQGALGHLRVNALQHLRHLLGDDAVERAEAHLNAVVLALLVEARDEVLDLREIAALGDDGDGVVHHVRLDERLLALGPLGEEQLQLARHIERLGLLEPDELHVAVGALRDLVERGQNLLHHFEVRGRARDDERVGPRVHDHVHAGRVRGAAFGAGDALEELLDDGGDFLGRAVLQLVDADFDVIALHLHVERLDDF